MKNKDISYLMQRVLDGTASSAEIIQYNAWCDSFQNNELIFQVNTEKKQLVYDRILEKIDRKPWSYRPFYRTLATAAAFILVLSMSLWIWRVYQDRGHGQMHEVLIAPENKALLYTADGRMIDLLAQPVDNIQLADGNQASLDKTQAQVNFYHANRKSANLIKEDINRIQVPAGGFLKLILQDSTVLFLNSNSSVSFPSTFVGNTREVNITGEAFFSVKRMEDRPFIVHTPKTAVKVLGTSFNITAYGNEPYEKTTVRSGLVEVKNKQFTVKVSPGKQAITRDEKSNIVTTLTDVDEAVSWREGLMVFNGQPLQTIMKQIERWYGVTVHYEGTIPQEKLYCMISRKDNVKQLMEILEATGNFKYSINKQVITIKKK